MRKKRNGRRGNTEAGETELATTLGVAKEANASAGDNGACSNGGD